ncbi:hypothetical protein SKAU_G00300570 [Synaphobranchus kaupii]|uniref:Uncharacterized protein n=1 Tax=Synaphobranchus kaupii TaxID=118154 RepID=A0A9Q1EVK8_SYNKA|nr:hypothetical protein SKAU_G00300570 [Synaphobranchus kaupii]
MPPGDIVHSCVSQVVVVMMMMMEERPAKTGSLLETVSASSRSGPNRKAADWVRRCAGPGRWGKEPAHGLDNRAHWGKRTRGEGTASSRSSSSSARGLNREAERRRKPQAFRPPAEPRPSRDHGHRERALRVQLPGFPVPCAA